MATISKWYHRDTTSPNLGTMPSGEFIVSPHLGAGTDATGFGTARDAIGTIGTSNPDIDATGTAAAVTTAQRLNIRRYVTRPLAAQNLSLTDNWTWSFARSESNTNHNGVYHLRMFLWRPTTGVRNGSGSTNLLLNTTVAAETAGSFTSVGGSWLATANLQEGDIIVMEVGDEFTQGMATAYTTFYSYDGTTEGSATTCASFVSSPTALTLSDNPWPKNPAINFQDPGVMMKAFGYAKRNWLWKPLKRPSLWTPELWRPEFWLPDHVAQGEICV